MTDDVGVWLEAVRRCAAAMGSLDRAIRRSDFVEVSDLCYAWACMSGELDRAVGSLRDTGGLLFLKWGDEDGNKQAKAREAGTRRRASAAVKGRSNRASVDAGNGDTTGDLFPVGRG